MAKMGIVSTRLLIKGNSLQTQDYLCPTEKLKKDIARLEKLLMLTTTSLANKRQELADRQREEDLEVAQGDLVLLEEEC